MKQLLSLILLAVLPMAASANDAEIDGIYYNFSNGEATVTYKGDNGATANSYSGDVVIPETVTFEDVVYKVTCIGAYAFYNCADLTSVTIPDGVTSIGDAEGGYTFYKCTSLTRIDIPYTVTSLGGGTFYNCSALADIYCYADEIPSTGNYVFYGLPADATLHVPVSDYKNAEPWSGFANIKYLSGIDIDGLTFFFSGNNAVLSGSKDVFENFECVIPESVIYDDKIYPVTHIGKYAFYHQNYMTSVSIPETVTSVGKKAFNNCRSLADVYCYAENVPGGAGSETFYNVPEDARLHVPASAIEQYKTTWPWNQFKTILPYNYIDGYYFNFYEGDNHAEVTGADVYAQVIIPSEVKYKGQTFAVTAIGDEAFRDRYMYSVVIPEGVTSIGRYAFSGCSSLKRIVIPESINSIGFHAFYECTALEKIIVPNIAAWCGISFMTSVSNPLYYAQHIYSDEETEITDLVIPEGVTSINRYAFSGCKYLTSVTIPSSMTSIGTGAFFGCNGLTKVYCYAEQVPETTSSAFGSTLMRNAFLYVPASSIESYKETSPWKRFGTIIALEAMACAKPTISYAGGELSFNCETEGVTFHSNITDADINSYEGDKVQLSVTYNISVYATKEGYLRSSIATATLCWIDATPTSEGLTDEDAVTEVKALPVLIQSQGGTISIQGAPEGTQVAIYGTDGKEYGSAICIQGGTTIATSLKPGSIAVVKIGEKAVKVTIK